MYISVTFIVFAATMFMVNKDYHKRAPGKTASATGQNTMRKQFRGIMFDYCVFLNFCIFFDATISGE